MQGFSDIDLPIAGAGEVGCLSDVCLLIVRITW